MAGALNCRVQSGVQLVCLGSGFGRQLDLVLVDAASLVIQARLSALPDAQAVCRILVPGPSGQLAVRERIGQPVQPVAERLLLIRHPDLR